MKTIYLVGGTMGVGKTTVCQRLKKELPNSIFLDGDWCWDSHPFQVTDETKAMVLDNICHWLNNALRCPAYENVIFCWVMHQQSIIDDILAQINVVDCIVKLISLTCDEISLRSRLNADVAQGIRTADVIERSVMRLPLYENLNTMKVDTSNKCIEAVVRELTEI